MRNSLNSSGYTLVEVLVIAAIFLMLAGLGTITLMNSEHKASLQADSMSLIADIKQQQIKSMQGDTEGRSQADYYGVHFDTKSYTLFHGTSYNPNDNSNLTVQLDEQLQFNPINLTNNNIIFIPLNGEVYGYSSLANSVALKDSTNQQKITLQFNYLGVIASIN